MMDCRSHERARFIRHFPPFDSGFVEFRYQLLGTTNVAGLKVPCSAVLKRFSPRPRSTAAGDLYARVVASLTVTSVSATQFEPLSRWPSEYVALDQRPTKLPPNRTVDYVVTNDQWCSVTNQRLRLLAAITRSSSHTKVHHNKALAFVCVTLMLMPGIFYLFFQRKHN